MVSFGMRFLSSILVLSVLGITSVSAAPSVRMLGTNAARVGTNTAVVKSDSKNTASTQRLGSVRAKNVTSSAPVTINKVPSKINPTTDSAEEARLSLGKYIHTTGVSAGTIKPVSGTTVNTGVSSSDFVNLVDRVQNLEDGKQDTIVPGDGLVMKDNKISLDSAVLQAQVEENVATVMEENYYTADEIDDILEENGIAPGGPTYVSVTNEENVYNAIDIADEFDKDFDFEGNN